MSNPERDVFTVLHTLPNALLVAPIACPDYSYSEHLRGHLQTEYLTIISGGGGQWGRALRP